ncbi:MAG: hypothetical protein PHR25_00270 [Clostridia bacterium]|nr:hypothetical protein [Clostridia bacterium]
MFLGGDRIHAVILISFAIIAYQLIDMYLHKLKNKRMGLIKQRKEELFLYKLSSNYYIKKHFINIEKKIKTSGHPYGITLKRYLFVKYILSIILFLLSIINNNNLPTSISIFIIVFYFPNILIYIKRNQERTEIVKEFRNVTDAMIVLLTAEMPFKNALRQARNVIELKRLKLEYTIFYNNYEMYNYNIKKATNQLNSAFDYYEVKLFLSTLLNSEREGNVIENLEKYNTVLDVSYSRYLNKQMGKKLIYLTLGTVLSLINILLMVMYPIFIEMAQNLQTIFK